MNEIPGIAQPLHEGVVNVRSGACAKFVVRAGIAEAKTWNAGCNHMKGGLCVLRSIDLGRLSELVQ